MRSIPLFYRQKTTAERGLTTQITHNQKLSWTQTLGCGWQTCPLPRPPACQRRARLPLHGHQLGPLTQDILWALLVWQGCTSLGLLHAGAVPPIRTHIPAQPSPRTCHHPAGWAAQQEHEASPCLGSHSPRSTQALAPLVLTTCIYMNL